MDGITEQQQTRPDPLEHDGDGAPAVSEEDNGTTAAGASSEEEEGGTNQDDFTNWKDLMVSSGKIPADINNEADLEILRSVKDLVDKRMRQVKLDYDEVMRSGSKLRHKRADYSKERDTNIILHFNFLKEVISNQNKTFGGVDKGNQQNDTPPFKRKFHDRRWKKWNKPRHDLTAQMLKAIWKSEKYVNVLSLLCGWELSGNDAKGGFEKLLKEIHDIDLQQGKEITPRDAMLLKFTLNISYNQLHKIGQSLVRLTNRFIRWPSKAAIRRYKRTLKVGNIQILKDENGNETTGRIFPAWDMIQETMSNEELLKNFNFFKDEQGRVRAVLSLHADGAQNTSFSSLLAVVARWQGLEDGLSRNPFLLNILALSESSETTVVFKSIVEQALKQGFEKAHNEGVDAKCLGDCCKICKLNGTTAEEGTLHKVYIDILHCHDLKALYKFLPVKERCCFICEADFKSPDYHLRMGYDKRNEEQLKIVSDIFSSHWSNFENERKFSLHDSPEKQLADFKTSSHMKAFQDEIKKVHEDPTNNIKLSKGDKLDWCFGFLLDETAQMSNYIVDCLHLELKLGKVAMNLLMTLATKISEAYPDTGAAAWRAACYAAGFRHLGERLMKQLSKEGIERTDGVERFFENDTAAGSAYVNAWLEIKKKDLLQAKDSLKAIRNICERGIAVLEKGLQDPMLDQFDDVKQTNDVDEHLEFFCMLFRCIGRDALKENFVTHQEHKDIEEDAVYKNILEVIKQVGAEDEDSGSVDYIKVAGVCGALKLNGNDCRKLLFEGGYQKMLRFLCPDLVGHQIKSINARVEVLQRQLEATVFKKIEKNDQHIQKLLHTMTTMRNLQTSSSSAASNVDKEEAQAEVNAVMEKVDICQQTKTHFRDEIADIADEYLKQYDDTSKPLGDDASKIKAVIDALVEVARPYILPGTASKEEMLEDLSHDNLKKRRKVFWRALDAAALGDPKIISMESPYMHFVLHHSYEMARELIQKYGLHPNELSTQEGGDQKLVVLGHKSAKRKPCRLDADKHLFLLPLFQVLLELSRINWRDEKEQQRLLLQL